MEAKVCVRAHGSLRRVELYGPATALGSSTVVLRAGVWQAIAPVCCRDCRTHVQPSAWPEAPQAGSPVAVLSHGLARCLRVKEGQTVTLEEVESLEGVQEMSLVCSGLPAPLQTIWSQAEEMQELVHTLMRGSAVLGGSDVPVAWLGGCHIVRVEGVSTATGRQMGQVRATTRIRLRRHSGEEKRRGSTEHMEAWMAAVNVEVVGHEEVVARLVRACGRMLLVPHAPPPAFLLTGCSGVGKTALARAFARNSGLPCTWVEGPQYYGTDGLEKLQKKLHEALVQQPCILVLDQLDTLCPPLLRSSGSASEGQDFAGTSEAQLSRALLQYLDDLRSIPLLEQVRGARQVLVVATACGMDQESETVDEQMLRTGRIDVLLRLLNPGVKERQCLLEQAFGCLRCPAGLVANLAQRTHGCVGSDLMEVARAATACALRRQQEAMAGGRKAELAIEAGDIDRAVDQVAPAVLQASGRLLQSKGMEEMRFADFGGAEAIVGLLEAAVVDALRQPGLHEALGVRPISGILFYGPTGTGKTTMAHALARECGLNLVTVRGPEILSPLVGQSEKNLHEVFTRAKTAAPCMLFMDQVEAIARPRGGDGASPAQDRLLSSLLTELDGVQEHKASSAAPKVLVVCAVTTARNGKEELRKLLDPALLRGGRLGEHVHFSRPQTLKEQAAVLARALAGRHKEQSREEVAEEAERVLRMLGPRVPRTCAQAEICSLSREAAMVCLREDIGNERVTDEHWRQATSTVWPTCSRR